jgi:protein TonB
MPNPVVYAVQILTFAMWLTCVGVGATGLELGWPGLRARHVEPPAIEATFIETPLSQESPPPEATPPEPVLVPRVDTPPQAPDLPDLPPLPELPVFVEKVAPVAPQIKPETKVQRIARTNDNTARSSTGTPSVQNLIMGVGEGRQPAPEYPHDALARHQEGTVIIQFMVGTSGEVLSAEVWQSSPYPMLNSEALRTVRGRWHFGAGPVRLYRVPIRFRIQ